MNVIEENDLVQCEQALPSANTILKSFRRNSVNPETNANTIESRPKINYYDEKNCQVNELKVDLDRTLNLRFL